MFNIINNYLKPGPATPDNEVRYRLLKPESERSKTVKDHFGKAYVAGNVTEGNDAVTKDNWAGGVQTDGEGDDSMLRRGESERAVQARTVANPVGPRGLRDCPGQRRRGRFRSATRSTAESSTWCGTGKIATTKPADIHDQLDDVGFTKERVQELVELIDKGIITDPSQVGGWPEYKGEPYADADKDGMPDAWEKKFGLNPNDASDAAKDLSGDGYTETSRSTSTA
jgi:hypothetical protein